MSIGVLRGDSPWSLAEPPGVNPIITAGDIDDVDAGFVADPFAVRRGDAWHLFFEVMNRGSGKGEIGYARSTDLTAWEYQGLVLAEPFHLSYPALYVEDDTVWMVPESWEAGQVRLYRADPFPGVWRLDRVLLDGVAGTDPTLYPNPSGGWSMLLCSAEGEHNETLWHFEAPTLRGPWQESRLSPLVSGDPSAARPGGHCFTHHGTRYRLAQDCSTRYGERLRSFPLAAPWSGGAADVLGAAGSGWRARGGHHADLHGAGDGDLVAFVDGEA